MRTLNPDLRQSDRPPFPSLINPALVALNFVSAYLELSLYSEGALLFPNFGSFLLACISAFHNRRLIELRHLVWLTTISGFALVTTGVAIVSWSSDPVENLLSLAQFVVSVFTAYGIFLATIGIARRQLAFLVGSILLVMIAGAALETLDPVRALSDYVRNLIYDRDILYIFERRDILQYGAIRPNFFAREPSLVGVHIGFAMAVALIAAPRMTTKTKLLLAFVVTVVTAWVVRSPTVVFFAAIVAFAPLMLPNAQGRRPIIERAAFVTALTLIVFTGPIASFLAEGIRGPVSDFVYSGSFYMRMVGPPAAAIAVVEQSPIVGVGVGGYDVAFSIVRSVYAAQGAFIYHPYLLPETDARYLISNAFWELPLFFGLVGFVIMAWLFHRLFLALGLRSTLFAFVSIAYAAQTLGGASAFRLWYFFFTFAALSYIVERDVSARKAHAGASVLPPDALVARAR